MFKNRVPFKPVLGWVGVEGVCVCVCGGEGGGGGGGGVEDYVSLQTTLLSYEWCQ